jgi:hypothetical protein
MQTVLISWFGSGNHCIYEVIRGKVFDEKGRYVFSEDRFNHEIKHGTIIVHEREES